MCILAVVTHLRTIEKELRRLANENNYLFSVTDLRVLLPVLSDVAFKSLLHRLCKNGYLHRVVKGLFLYPHAPFSSGDVLFHVAAKLRNAHFNYLSLETVLSREGVISQIPIQWISLMSSGRSYRIICNGYGTIEFVHTKRKPSQLLQHLTYDPLLRLWVADTYLAIEDMKNTHRSLENYESI